jgi:gliding motility-associated-like protein
MLKAIPVGIRDFKYFAVFNRYGQRIFYTTNSSVGWNGNINGVPQNPGTYVWMASGTAYDRRQINVKGTVVLIK